MKQDREILSTRKVRPVLEDEASLYSEYAADREARRNIATRLSKAKRMRWLTPPVAIAWSSGASANVARAPGSIKRIRHTQAKKRNGLEALSPRTASSVRFRKRYAERVKRVRTPDIFSRFQILISARS